MLATAFIIWFPAIILFFFLFKFIFLIGNLGSKKFFLRLHSGRIIHNTWLLKTYTTRVKKNVNTTPHGLENAFQYILMQPLCMVICRAVLFTRCKRNSLPILLSCIATANSPGKNISQQSRTANTFAHLTASEIIYCKLIMLAQLTHSRWQGT
jgi:hypothetical protein